MKIKTSFLIVSAVLFFMFFITSFSSQDQADPFKGRDKIPIQNSLRIANFHEGNFAGITAGYTEDARIFIPLRKMVAGDPVTKEFWNSVIREAIPEWDPNKATGQGPVFQKRQDIAKFWKAVKNKGVGDLVFTQKFLHIDREVAYELSEYSFISQGKKIPGSSIMTIWCHQMDCGWEICSEVIN